MALARPVPSECGARHPAGCARLASLSRGTRLRQFAPGARLLVTSLDPPLKETEHGLDAGRLSLGHLHAKPFISSQRLKGFVSS